MTSPSALQVVGPPPFSGSGHCGIRIRRDGSLRQWTEPTAILPAQDLCADARRLVRETAHPAATRAGPSGIHPERQSEAMGKSVVGRVERGGGRTRNKKT